MEVKEYLYVSTKLETLMIETDMLALFADVLTLGIGEEQTVAFYRLCPNVYAYLWRKLEEFETNALNALDHHCTDYGRSQLTSSLAVGLSRWQVVERWVQEQWTDKERDKAAEVIREVREGKIKKLTLPRWQGPKGGNPFVVRGTVVVVTPTKTFPALKTA